MKVTTDRNVLTVPVYTSPHACAVLEHRFNVAHHIYNSFLGECERRRRCYISLPEYAKAVEILKIYHQESKRLSEATTKRLKASLSKKRRELETEYKELFEKCKRQSGFYLRSAKKKYGLDNSLEMYASAVVQNTWLGAHIDSSCRNKLMERAFATSEKVLYGKKILKKNGRWEKPKARFLRFGKDYIYSVEGKRQQKSPSPLKAVIREGKPYLVWGELLLPMLCEGDKKAERILSNFDCIKYVRLKRKMVSHKWLYEAQLICVGKAHRKPSHVLGKGTIGVDIGPSLIAYVTDDYADLRQIFLGKELAAYNDLLLRRRKIERKIDRQRRANNPDCYSPDGVPIKGKWPKNKSRRQQLVEDQLADLQRRLAESRRHSTNKLAWELRAQGDDLRIDMASYKVWQKQYGKSVGAHAPGMLVERLKYVFESTGGKVSEINVYESKSSQTCPLCGKVERKGLTQGIDSRNVRIHDCECGFVMQRDIVSSLCNKFYNSRKKLVDVGKAKAFVVEKRPLLRACIERVIQSARAGHSVPSTFGTLPELERIVRNGV